MSTINIFADREGKKSMKRYHNTNLKSETKACVFVDGKDKLDAVCLELTQQSMHSPREIILSCRQLGKHTITSLFPPSVSHKHFAT